MTEIALILTRPIDSARRVWQALSTQARDRVAPVYSPLLRIERHETDISLSADETAIFTSANGVRFAPVGAGRKAYCVGLATTEIAADNGWQAEQLGQTADELVAKLQRRSDQHALVHFCGVHRRGEIAERLAEAGMAVRVSEVYDQIAQPLTDAARDALGGRAILPLYSPRTAVLFAQQTEGVDLTRLHIIAMSSFVAQPLAGRALAEMRILDAPTRSEMGLALEKLCRDISLP